LIADFWVIQQGIILYQSLYNVLNGLYKQMRGFIIL